MSKKEQIKIVRELCNNMRDCLIGQIKTNAIPDNWDGHELRTLLADNFKQAASIGVIRREPRWKRAKAYKNVIVVNNL